MKQRIEDKTQERKRYEPPAVVYEAPLEVRAGSPLSLPADPLKALLDPANALSTH